ncbi:hypothetical protein QPK87_37895 [Kamptonema cortianum]|nr:hypothetical protein [Geitlerinema splendidum]MDK3162281.1 hypothetical protein [Kamptonema cortianum]
MSLKLSVFAAEKKTQIFENLLAGLPPAEGKFDEETWAIARKKEKPQMGVTTYSQNSMSFEYIFQDPLGSSVVLSVDLDSPERIVYLPIPDWVVCNIWQGDVSGSYVFESEAKEAMERLRHLLSPEENESIFDQRNLTGKN